VTQVKNLTPRATHLAATSERLLFKTNHIAATCEEQPGAQWSAQEQQVGEMDVVLMSEELEGKSVNGLNSLRSDSQRWTGER
jgi:hypothetical protein